MLKGHLLRPIVAQPDRCWGDVGCGILGHLRPLNCEHPLERCQVQIVFWADGLDHVPNAELEKHCYSQLVQRKEDIPPGGLNIRSPRSSTAGNPHRAAAMKHTSVQTTNAARVYVKYILTTSALALRARRVSYWKMTGEKTFRRLVGLYSSHHFETPRNGRRRERGGSTNKSTLCHSRKIPA